MWFIKLNPDGFKMLVLFQVQDVFEKLVFVINKPWLAHVM